MIHDGERLARLHRVEVVAVLLVDEIEPRADDADVAFGDVDCAFSGCATDPFRSDAAELADAAVYAGERAFASRRG